VKLLACLLLVCSCGRLGFRDDNEVRDAPPAVEAVEATPAAFSTSSPTFVAVPGATLTIPPSPGTTWLLLTSATLVSTGVAVVNVEARYLVDGIERGVGESHSTAGAGPWQHFYVLEGGADPQTVVYELRDRANGISTIDQLHTIAVPLPADAEPHYVSRDDVEPVSAQANTPLHALSLGSLSGTYVVLLLANGTELPSTANLWLEWRGPNDEVLMRESQFPREPRQALLTARVLSITAADATFTLYAYTGGPTGAQTSYVRAFAMRSDAFVSIDHGFSSTPITTMSATPSMAQQVLTTPSDANRYLYLTTAWAEEDCLNTADVLRRMHFTIDADEHIVEHATDNCAYQLTYGVTKLLPARPNVMATGISSGNGQVTILGDSQIVLLGLP
jgi:hypothetical protein